MKKRVARDVFFEMSGEIKSLNKEIQKMKTVLDDYREELIYNEEDIKRYIKALTNIRQKGPYGSDIWMVADTALEGDENGKFEPYCIDLE
jgi:hypothetical protein